jgi:hypothetical protein
MKIGIYYDSLTGKGGAQKVVIQLANELHADIITSGFDREAEEWLPLKNKVIDIGNITSKYNAAISFFFETPLRFLFYKNADYDIQIFCGVSSIFAAKKGKHNIWFSFTPNRLLYDLREWKLRSVSSSFIRKFFFQTHILLFNAIDQKVVRENFRTIIAQTECVKERIEKYYGLDSKVI